MRRSRSVEEGRASARP